MTLRKILSPISLTLGLALISTVLTACGEGTKIKVECSRPQDAFNASCLDATDPTSVDNRLTQCLANGNAHDSCTNLIAVNTGDIDGYSNFPTTTAGLTSNARHEDSFLNLPVGNTDTFEINTNGTNTGDGYYLITAGSTLYAVLLPDTNLGAPFLTTTPNATWTGTYNMPNISDDGATAAARAISFAINFRARTMKGTATTVTSGSNLTIDTSFDQYGAITGGFRVNKQTSGGADDPITGKVVGLIGTQGTVGIFQGADNTDSYSGGFVAANPAQ